MAQSEHMLDQGLTALGIACSAQQRTQLLTYLALLQKWNRAYNLTAVRAPEAMVSKHLLDSLSVLPYLQGERIADVGSGPGLPGIPLAIMAPDRHFTLIDSNGKKSRFQLQSKMELGLANVDVVGGRVEAYQPQPPFDAIISRAFASIADMLNGCRRLCRQDGCFLAMKGVYPDEELAAMPAGYRVAACHKLTVPQCDGERHLLEIRPTP